MYRRLLAICVALLSADGASASGAESAPAPDPAKAAIRAEIWSKEQMIYAGRSRGDLTPYVANTSRNYVS